MPETDTDVAQPSEKQTTGEVDPSIWEEAVAVTGRPNDTPLPNSTFAERTKAPKKGAAAKQVNAGAAENKAVKSTTARRK